jgi:uncharacterized protein (DUF58 family)
VTPVVSRSWPKHAFRIVSLVAPSAIAWSVAFTAADPGDLNDVVAFTLGPLWALLAGALLLRTIGVVSGRRREPTAPLLAQIDILTGSGVALAWLSALAIMAAVWLGWASLAVVGLLGTGLFHVVALLTFVAVRGGDPMRRATISRRFVPEVVTEGDAVIEELRFAGSRIPIGFRLFTTGRVGARWPTSRHVIEAVESGAEVVLESDIGPAVRGDHDAEPLEVWLQDTFGLCRSVRVHVGAARLTVQPRLPVAEQTASLLDRGAGPREPRPATRLPTEGSFRLREYQQGDDVRRIHWVRSLAARELIVRLPDELPPDRPHVRLVLDTFFPEAPALSCDAPAELLDCTVGVWLAVGRALAESGARVTLVTAVHQGAAIAKARHDLVLRTPGPALRLGAQVSWQGEMRVDELLTDEATFVVSRGVLVHPSAHPKARWIVVLPAIARGLPWPFQSGARFPFPMGSSENRWSHRRREGNRLALARRDHAQALLAIRADIARPPPGSFVAVPTRDGAIRLEAVR